MLNCKEVSDRANRLIDGELGLFDRLQMRLHLAMCTGCTNFVDQLRISRDLVASSAEAQPLSPADKGNIDAILSALHDGKQRGD